LVLADLTSQMPWSPGANNPTELTLDGRVLGEACGVCVNWRFGAGMQESEVWEVQ